MACWRLPKLRMLFGRFWRNESHSINSRYGPIQRPITKVVIKMRPTLPPLDKNVNLAPHIVLLGAGASIAAYRDWGAIEPTLPSMQDLLDVLDLRGVISGYGHDTANLNFEAFYDELASSGEDESLRKLIESRVFDYFAALKLPERPTIYDYLVLSLRKKDLIATFNWDPFLLQAYMRSQVAAGENLPRIAFLHGNVLVGACSKHQTAGVIGRRCSKCGDTFTPSKLLYPVEHKDYSSDPFIKSEWDTLRKRLMRGYYLTVFGYSAPKTDVEARKLMLDDWKKNPSIEFCEVDVVDVKSREEIEANWEEFFYSHHYSVTTNIWSSYLFKYPRRSCDAFASATLAVDPWHENPFPKFHTLDELHSWVGPLIAEEVKYESNGIAFSGDPLLPNLN